MSRPFIGTGLFLFNLYQLISLNSPVIFNSLSCAKYSQKIFNTDLSESIPKTITDYV